MTGYGDKLAAEKNRRKERRERTFAICVIDLRSLYLDEERGLFPFSLAMALLGYVSLAALGSH